VTCQLWDRLDLDEPGVRMSLDGKRRLIAPPWQAAQTQPGPAPQAQAAQTTPT